MYPIAVVARVVLALVFGVAGIGKLFAGFVVSRKSMADFGVPRWLVAPVSVSLPLVELIIAVLLLTSRSGFSGSVAAFALLLFFNAAIAMNLAFGKTPNCNCFGQLHSQPIGWTTFARNGLLAAVAAWLVWQLPHYRDSSLVGMISSLSNGGIAAVIAGSVGFAGIAAEGVFTLHVLRQNGRILLRIEALEATKTIGGQAAVPTASVPQGLPIGAKAIAFQLPTLDGGTASLAGFLSQGRGAVLLFTDPNCGPCNLLMPEVAGWQKAHAAEVDIVLISSGRLDDNRAKANEFGLVNVLVEKKRSIAEKYRAYGTPSAVVIRRNGSVGSHVVGGADAIRRLFLDRVWDEAAYAAFLRTNGQPRPTTPAKQALPIGSPAPPFALPDLEGKTVEPSALTGNATVLLFWNPACGFCQKMLSQLRDWETSHPERTPRLLLISSGSRETNAQMGLSSPIVIDEKFAIGQLYGATGTPSAVLIDANARVASKMTVGAPSVLNLLGADESDREKASLALAATK